MEGNIQKNGNLPTLMGKIFTIPRIDKTLTKSGMAADAAVTGELLRLKALDNAYPVGAIYLSTVDKNPMELFGGKWERIKDVFLLGAGDRWAAGEMDGEANVILNSDQIPTHSHEVRYTVAGGNTGFESDTLRAYKHGETTGEVRTMYLSGGGGNEAHNNMPPYLAVYMWKRVA